LPLELKRFLSLFSLENDEYSGFEFWRPVWNIALCTVYEKLLDGGDGILLLVLA